jgi:hypothetical protein
VASVGRKVGGNRPSVGQRELSLTADTYTHVLLDDGRDIDLAALLAP